MSTNDDFDVDKYMHSFTGYAYPAVENVPENSRMFRRRWILRVNRPLAATHVLSETVRGFESDAQAEILRNYGDAAAVDIPQVTPTRIDDHHIVFAIDCPKSTFAVGDVAAMVTWMVLRAADKDWGVEELEGIPRRYWFAMR